MDAAQNRSASIAYLEGPFKSVEELNDTTRAYLIEPPNEAPKPTSIQKTLPIDLSCSTLHVAFKQQRVPFRLGSRK
jgi:hypothetical protein